MGGSGSGRWGFHSKRYTKEESLTLDLKFLLKHGGIQPRSGALHWSRNEERFASIGYEIRKELEGNLRMILDYKSNGEIVSENINLIRTSQNFGGYRYWMLCPLIRNGVLCSNKCSKLYSSPGCKYFGCRQCLDLTYESSQDCHKYDGIYAMLARETNTTPERVKELMKRKNW